MVSACKIMPHFQSVRMQMMNVLCEDKKAEDCTYEVVSQIEITGLRVGGLKIEQRELTSRLAKYIFYREYVRIASKGFPIVSCPIQVNSLSATELPRLLLILPKSAENCPRAPHSVPRHVPHKFATLVRA
jgi:hypothetical protein